MERILPQDLENTDVELIHVAGQIGAGFDVAFRSGDITGHVTSPVPSQTGSEGNIVKGQQVTVSVDLLKYVHPGGEWTVLVPEDSTSPQLEAATAAVGLWRRTFYGEGLDRDGR